MYNEHTWMYMCIIVIFIYVFRPPYIFLGIWVFGCLYDTERSVKSSTFTICRRSFPTQNKWHHSFCGEYFVGGNELLFQLQQFTGSTWHRLIQEEPNKNNLHALISLSTALSRHQWTKNIYDTSSDSHKTTYSSCRFSCFLYVKFNHFVGIIPMMIFFKSLWVLRSLLIVSNNGLNGILYQVVNEP